MQAIRDKDFANDAVTIDGHNYLNCRFSACTLIYGGEDFGWDNCFMKPDCKFVFKGPAARTVEFLRCIGYLPITPPVPMKDASDQTQ